MAEKKDVLYLSGNIVRADIEGIINEVAKEQGWKIIEPRAGRDYTKKLFILKKLFGFKKLNIKVPFSGEPKTLDIVRELSFSYKKRSEEEFLIYRTSLADKVKNYSTEKNKAE